MPIDVVLALALAGLFLVIGALAVWAAHTVLPVAAPFHDTCLLPECACPCQTCVVARVRRQRVRFLGDDVAAVGIDDATRPLLG